MSCLSVPLVARGRTLGALSLYSHRRDAFIGEHQAALTFAAAAASALAGVRDEGAARAYTKQGGQLKGPGGGSHDPAPGARNSHHEGAPPGTHPEKVTATDETTAPNRLVAEWKS